MNKELNKLTKTISLGLAFTLPLGLFSQEAPTDSTVPTNPGGEYTEVIPDGQDVPFDLSELESALASLQEQILAIVESGEYTDGQIAELVQSWIAENGIQLELIEALQQQADQAADGVVLPDSEIVGEVAGDIAAFEQAQAKLEESLAVVLETDFSSEEERNAAIEQWKSDHAAEIAAQEAARAELIAQIEQARAGSEDLGERPEDSQAMQDLNALYEDKLAALSVDNAALSDALDAASVDREEALSALEQARTAREVDTEAARELARSKSEESRSDISADKRPGD